VSTLLLLRHGQSTWNAENRFTGWVDVDLSEKGEEEARHAGELLTAGDCAEPQVVQTSVLTRAIRTAEIALHAAGLSYLPVRRHWRLNERHYGSLQGLDKAETSALHGAEQVKVWRRSYDVPPPRLDDEPERLRRDPRYAGVLPALLPASECLADVVARVRPHFEDEIAPELLAGKTVLVVAHGNSIRALVYILEHLTAEEIVEVEVPTGIPRRYELTVDLEIASVGYLGSAEDAAAAAELVRHQADLRTG
jgi:2,3-bisphosphoglycerate-dependent phosphoglycerate mutase